MATTPEGTPYVQSSDLVANYPAASLALANRVDLVGVLPFATSTARGTAIPSPTDGQYTYLQNTNTTQFWNGAAWQTAGGTSIISPTSIANSGGSASASGGQVTFTGVSSISLNGVFNSGFENYLIQFRGNASPSNPSVQLRLRVAGTDNTGATSYARASTTAGSTPSNDSTSTSNWFIGFFDSGNAQFMSSSVQLFAPNLAVNTVGLLQNTSGVMVSVTGGLRHNVATAYDGFTVYTSASTMSGIVRVYGYQSS